MQRGEGIRALVNGSIWFCYGVRCKGSMEGFSRQGSVKSSAEDFLCSFEKFYRDFGFRLLQGMGLG